MAPVCDSCGLFPFSKSSVDILAVILDQDVQISASSVKSNWLALVKELTKTFLQRLQNLEPLSPLMEKQYLCAAPSMIQKPIRMYNRLYGIGCGMPLGSCNWIPVWPVLMTWCTSTFMSWLLLAATLFMCKLLMAQSDPSVGGVLMFKEFLEAGVNGPCLS